MRLTLKALSVLLVFSVVAVGCSDIPTSAVNNSETEAQSATATLQGSAANQVASGSQGAVLFQWPFLAGFVIPDAQSDDVCVVVMSKLNINDKAVLQPNGQRHLTLEDHDANFYVFTETKPVFSGETVDNLGEADLIGSGSFSSSATFAGQSLVELSVNGAGTVGNNRHVVCEGHFNSQGPAYVDMKLQ